jgi:hypothetical protein
MDRHQRQSVKMKLGRIGALMDQTAPGAPVAAVIKVKQMMDVCVSIVSIHQR